MNAPRTWTDLGIDAPNGGTGEYRTLCPQCNPTRKPEHRRIKDLSCNLGEGTYHCHHCGWSGGLQGGTSSEPDWRRPVTPPPSKRKTYEPPRPLPQVTMPTLWQTTVEWFAERGISEDTLLAFGITASVEYCPVCESKVGNVLFPYYVDGTHVNTKHRCRQKHFRMEKGAERVLYNLDACRESDTVVIVEGEIDALSLHEAGIPYVVSVPDGAPSPTATAYSTKFTFLESAEAFFASVRTVILATDADEPGQKLMQELARRIGPERCRRVIWDDGIKDANECLTVAGPEYLRTVIEDAEPWPVEGIVLANDLAPEMDSLYDNGTDPGLRIGYPVFDEHYRVKQGYVTVVTGIPGHGKSGFVNQMMVRLAHRHGWSFAIYSPEQQPLPRLVQSLIEIRSGEPLLEGPTPRMARETMHQQREWVSDHFSFLNPEEPSIATILDLARIEVFRRGVKGIVIDPWNELEHLMPHGQSETLYISEALSKFRRFAVHHGVHIWLIAHPTKMQRKEDGSEPVPTLYDVAGSAHFRNKADMGLTVWRDVRADDRKVSVYVTKVRYADHGRLGAVQFDYSPANKRLIEKGSLI